MAKADKDVDLSRLTQAIASSRKSLQFAREDRREAVRQFAGRHYSENGTKENVPVNLISLYISIVGRSLIAKNPRVMLSTFQAQSKPAVSAMQTWANRQIESMRLMDSLQRAVVDSLFSIGILKVSLASPTDAEMAGWNMKAGTAFAEVVDLDDFVFDTHARDFSQVSFIGHRYRAPLEAVKDAKIYGKARKELTVSEDKRYNDGGDERVGRIGQSDSYGDMEEFEDLVDLWEIYIPRKRLILTLADQHVFGGMNSGYDEPLRQQEWIGPDCGPYHILSMGVVPGNAMPKAPLQDLVELHLAANRAYRKVMRQVDRQKDVLMVQGGADADGRRVVEANDGEAIKVDNPDSVKLATFGGPNQTVSAMALVWKDLFSFLGGNLEIMGGLSPQSKTLGQDRMLNENSSRTVADMQDRTIQWTSEALKALCWYWWHDPFHVMRVEENLPGMPELSITRQLSPQQRMQSKWDELEIRVDPYSMQHSTPSSRAQALNQVMQQIVVPLMPMLQQQGTSVDVNAYLSKLAQYLDMPDLGEIITTMEPPQVSEPEGGDGALPEPGKPAETTRNYVRESTSGRTRQGNDMNMINSLMGIDAGGAQKNGSTGGVQ